MSACFCGKLKSSPTYLSSKNKKIRDRVDPRVQLVWRLRVKVSCHSPFPISHTPFPIPHTPFPQSLFYNSHSTITIPQSPFHDLHSTILILQSSFYNPHSTILVLQSSFYNPHSTIPIPQSSFYNPYSTILILCFKKWIKRKCFFKQRKKNQASPINWRPR